MVEVQKRIFVGNELECFTEKEGWVTVHACKHPCHARAVGYGNYISPSHPNYLIKEIENNLYLNIVDAKTPIFRPEIFQAFFEFSKKHYENGKSIFIHCNQGESRAPSLALLFMSKYLGVIGNNSFENAKNDFVNIYETYRPGMGITKYLTDNWQTII